MNSESYKKRRLELEKLGAANEAAGKIVSTPSFLDYRDGYRMMAGITLYMCITTLLFMVLAFVFYLNIEPQEAFATTTHGEVHQIFPAKLTN